MAVGLVMAVALVLAVGVFGTSVAGADVSHPFLSSFDEAPGVGMLREPGPVAVDRATGDVFVADWGTGVVDEFDSSGKYLTRFGIGIEASGLAVDEATGVVYAAEPVEDVVLAYKSDGSGGFALVSRWNGGLVPGGSFGSGEVLGVAVDNSTNAGDPSAGDVYVVDSEGPAVNKAETQYAAAEVIEPTLAGGEGEFVRDLVGKGLEEPNAITIDDATGRVYLADSEKGFIETFNDSGVYEAKLKGNSSPIGSLEEGNVTALAVDETTGDVLVAQEEHDVVSELTPGTGEWVGWITGAPTGPFGEVRGVGTTGDGQRVYVPDAGLGVVDVYGPGVVVPDVRVKAPSQVTGTSATLRGTINGEGETATYHFELGENEDYGGFSTAATKTASGSEETVQASVNGLKPATKYYVRLVGEDHDGTSCSVGLSFATEGATGGGFKAESLSCGRPRATIESESTTNVTTSEATLNAQIDPYGHQTSAYFQYGTQPCASHSSSCTDVPQPPRELGPSETTQPLSTTLTGLQPNTTYHYRTIATNTLGTAEDTERTFTTHSMSTMALPDGRAWEMVTPPNKNGAPIEALTRQGGAIRAAEDGDALAYVANGAIEDEVQGNRSFELQQDLAVRRSLGWTSQDIATPNARGAGSNFGAPEYQFFSPDLSLALVEPYVSEPALAPGVPGNVYLRDDRPIAPETSESPGYEEADANSWFLAPGFLPLVSAVDGVAPSVSFLAAAPRLDHVVLSSSSALLGSSSSAGLYVWSVGGGLRFVSVLPNGVPQSSSALALGYYQVRAHAISDDGSRVIWTANQESPAHLYMRDTNLEETVQLDVAQEGLAEPDGAARFQTASSDGGRVFFTDDQKLLADASVEPAREVSDLYECEMVEETAGDLACRLHDLTVPLRAEEHAAVQGQVLGESEDGTILYLVAKGVLAGNENAHGEVPVPGRDNLYELQYEGGEWRRTFIAVLSGEDAADWDAGPNVSDENVAFQTVRVSPNGRYLAFMSQQSLTGYESEDISSKKSGERLDQEVYLYDGDTGGLTCASCDPSGARPVGVLDQETAGEGFGLVVDRRQSWRGHWLAGSIPGWTSESITNTLYQSRYLSDEGRLFFDSADPLVPGITAPTREESINGVSERVGVENVYEYEPDGLGNCQSAPGCVGLISSGASENESAFLEATPSGNDVFFLTTAQLLPQDSDDAADIYDARVCTASVPCLEPPAASGSPCATLAECHAPGSTGQVSVGPSGSATFSGSGNLTPTSSAPKREVKGAVKAKPKPLPRAQKLTKALEACRKAHPRAKHKRQLCEAHARKLYGAHHAATHKKQKKAGGK